MCTTNTPRVFEASKVSSKLRSLAATLPYEKIKIADLTKCNTKFQKIRLIEIKQKRICDLKKDRNKFLHKLQAEKKQKTNELYLAAQKIQSVFRGFLQRRKFKKYHQRKKTIQVLSQNEIVDELCNMAAALPFRPINKLNLETRSKISKRKRKIERAAAFTIQKFFKMIVERKKAKRVVEVKRSEKIYNSSRTITRTFRHFKMKNFAKRAEVVKQNVMALKLQSATRKYFATNRFCNFIIKQYYNYFIIVY
jgi:hypothetical protein